MFRRTIKQQNIIGFLFIVICILYHTACHKRINRKGKRPIKGDYILYHWGAHKPTNCSCLSKWVFRYYLSFLPLSLHTVCLQTDRLNPSARVHYVVRLVHTYFVLYAVRYCFKKQKFNNQANMIYFWMLKQIVPFIRTR